MPRGVVVVECYSGFIMIKTGTMQQTSCEFKIKSHNAQWLVPPFYVRHMNTEGGKINYVGPKKQTTNMIFVSPLLTRNAKMKHDTTGRK